MQKQILDELQRRYSRGEMSPEQQAQFIQFMRKPLTTQEGNSTDPYSTFKRNPTPAEGKINTDFASVLQNKMKLREPLTEGESRWLSQYNQRNGVDQNVQDSIMPVVQGTVDGASLNLFDEGSAMVQAMFGGNYDKALEDERKQSYLAKTQYPDQYSIGNTAGTLATGLASIASTGGMSLPAQMGVLALENGGMQALSEFGKGEKGFNQRVSGMDPMSISIATAGGATAPLLGRLVGKGAEAVINSNRFDPPKTTTRGVEDILREAILHHDQTGGFQDIFKKTGELGTLSDVPGEIRGIAQGLVTTKGEGGTNLANFVAGRNKDASGRVSEEVDYLSQKYPSATSIEQQQDALRKGDISNQFEEALKDNPNVNLGPIRKAITEKKATAGFDVEKDIKKIEQALPQKRSAGTSNDATINYLRQTLGINTPESVPAGVLPAKKLRAHRSAINKMITNAEKGGDAEAVATLMSLKDTITKELEKIPGFKEASDSYASSKRVSEAVDYGRGVMRGGRAGTILPEQFQKELADLPDAEREAVLAGMNEDLLRLLGTSRNDVSTAIGEANKGFNSDKIKMAFGEDGERYLNSLEREKIFKDTHNKLNTGSETASRMKGVDLVGNSDPSRTNTDVIDLITLGMKKRINDSLIDPLFHKPKRKANNKALGEALSATGQKRDDIITELLSRGRRKKKGVAISKAIGTGINAGVLTQSREE